MKLESWWNSICNSSFVLRNMGHMHGISFDELDANTRDELAWLFQTLNAESGR